MKADNKKLYICVIDISQRGGIEEFAIKLCTALRETNIEIISLYKCADRLPPSGITITYINNFPYQPSKKFHLAQSIIEMRKLVGSNLLIHTYNNIFCIDALLSPKKLPNTIFTEHSAYYAVRPVVRFLRNFLLIFSRHIVCQTSVSQEIFDSLPFTRVSKLAPMWIKNQITSVRTNNILKIAFAGRLEMDKGILDFCALFTSLSSADVKVEAHVFGNGEFTDHVIRFARDNRGSFYYHGHVSDLSVKLSDIDFLAILSKSESFSIVGIEALSVGCGLIFYKDLDGPNEYCTNDTSIKICRGSRGADFFPTAQELIDKKSKTLFRERCTESVKKYTEKSFKESWKSIISNV